MLVFLSALLKPTRAHSPRLFEPLKHMALDDRGTFIEEMLQPNYEKAVGIGRI